MLQKLQKQLHTFKIVMFVGVVIFSLLSALGDLTVVGTTPTEDKKQDTECWCGNQTANVSAIRAPLLTIGSVLFFLISRIPTPNHSFARYIEDGLATLASAGVGLAAGWYWLATETDGNPGTYLIILMSAAFLITAALLTGAMIAAIGDRPAGGDTQL